jgi:predicted Zn-dependent protease
MKKNAFVLAIVFLLAAVSAQADKLKGFIWEASPSALVVEGQTVRLAPETRVSRPNHKDITVKDLRIGWEVEVETRGDEGSPVAREVRVKEARYQKEKVEGVVDGVNHTRFFVDGDEIRLKQGAVPKELKPGMRFKGEGIRQDDRSIILEQGQVLPGGFEGEEAQFMASAQQEISQLQRQLKKVNDPELQAYVDRIGRSLVPKWVDGQQYNFTFTLVEDPTLNAFALPDGTVVIHSGLLAALENEAQLATVLGHEIAHATHRHSYRGYKDQQGKKKWLGLGSLVAGVLVGTQTDSALAGLVTGAATNLALKAAVNGHGRKLEDEADLIGLYYMVEAGYDYMEAPEVWRVFGKYSKDQSKVSNFFFSDHSTHAARIKNLTKSINEDYRAQVPRTTLRTGEEEYQKAAEKLASQNAMANFQKQEYAQAGRALAAAVERNPNDAKARYNLGRVLWAQGGVQNAERVLEELSAAAQLDPTFAAPWRDIGIVFYELRDGNRAVQALEQYLQLAPDAPEGPKIRAFVNAMREQG